MINSFLTKLRQASRWLSKSKFLFQKPKDVTLIFFGTPSSTVLLEKLFEEDYAIIDPTYESTVHAWDLFTALVKKPFHKATMTALYFESFLRRLRPAKVVTFTDNHSDFYRVRKKVEDLEARFFVFQNGNRLVSHWPSVPVFRPGDAAFLLTEDYADYFRDHIAGGAEVHATGKIVSDQISLGSELKDQKPVKAAIISQWRRAAEEQVWVGGTRVSGELFYKPELDMAPKIFLAAKELGIDVEILGSASEQNQEDEKAFFTKILGNEEWQYCSKTSGEGNSKRLGGYDLFFCFDSTLGYELCSLKTKCVFVDVADYPLRVSLGHPNESRLINSNLLLKTEAASQWPQKIKKILEMSKQEYSKEAKQVVGEGPLSWTIEDVRKAVK